MDAVIDEALEKGVTAEEFSDRRAAISPDFCAAPNVWAVSADAGYFSRKYDLRRLARFLSNRLEWMATATPNRVKATANKWLKANHYTMLVKPFDKLTAGKTDVDRKILPALNSAAGNQISRNSTREIQKRFECDFARTPFRADR